MIFDDLLLFLINILSLSAEISQKQTVRRFGVDTTLFTILLQRWNDVVCIYTGLFGYRLALLARRGIMYFNFFGVKFSYLYLIFYVKGE